MAARRLITDAELRQRKDDVWVAIHGKVYDLGRFEDHPGGMEILRYEAGKDATAQFEDIGHTRRARQDMDKYYVGEYAAVGSRSTVPSGHSPPPPVPSFLTSPPPPVSSSLTSSPPPMPSFPTSPAARPALKGEITGVQKVPLAPGHSAMDWVRVTSAMPTPNRTRYTMAQVAQHCTRNDAWIVLHGLVYDVTRYVDFHPGGPSEIMRGVGRDATQLFDATHPWVNVNFLLQKCCMGQLDIA
ncbi:unnamed protein product (mitochondrion) [Plasmodiophora brassicae]|uniref:Cytochrome b5 heme-binding domain-containing protein n=1 Tax=Plasmodiophora brassicae TaxID=37360 RepID=A0A0G4IND1_PLABS|nr:hypothetical protein PBRA_005279 [Plasmodiophora brassicae]SPQ95339.1 unnamed protein product [Plasmodiophora brassicae]